jgi:opacity protein-like surface antigen
MTLVLCAPKTYAQQGLELGVGWSHLTGNFGLDGYDLDAGYWFSPRAAVVFNYDDVYDNSPISAFALSSLGSVRVKSREQNFLLGPRIAFPGGVRNNSKVIPFAEALFGGSHLRSTISEAIVGAANSTDSAFTWGVGGGVDYAASSHFTGRVGLDLIRTHFSDTGQSRLRLLVGGTYMFGGER